MYCIAYVRAASLLDSVVLMYRGVSSNSSSVYLFTVAVPYLVQPIFPGLDCSSACVCAISNGFDTSRLVLAIDE